MSEKKRPYILQICGLKNTGKTTFVRGLTTYLSQLGYEVAVVKHDGHEFDLQSYNEDNFLHYKAGASASVVFSKGQWLCVQREKRSLESFIEQFSDFDYVLIEGCKNAAYPKVEMLRKGISESPVSNPKGRIGCIGDEIYPINEPCFLKEDENLYEKIIKYIA
ncbi:MAG TPA: molybdopterin-guanine dinucleotide biosynthesis protein B [Candidatus Scybalomonas excrementigallinarum]|nr:molybdopterin-guanine dinucleotide biosynthesis protein B [Candidatus Scybalomonas excrementigallinarum]